jgi:Mn2+/Fe2+ NRAMP family transporter
LVLGLAFLVRVQFAISDLEPIKMLFYSQVPDGLIAPLLVVLLVRLTASRTVMGDFAKTVWMTIGGWLAVAVLVSADLALGLSVFTSRASD